MCRGRGEHDDVKIGKRRLVVGDLAGRLCGTIAMSIPTVSLHKHSGFAFSMTGTVSGGIIQ